MWVFSENTIAGDLGVTPIIQCLASMLITSTLVHTDLHHHAIQPLPFCYPHVEGLPDPRTLFTRSERNRKSSPKSTGPGSPDGTVVTNSNGDIVPSEKPHGSGASTSSDPWPKKGFAYYYWMLVRFIFEGTEKNMMLARPGIGAWFGRLVWTAAQGAAIGVVFGFPIWCLAIVILGPIYGTKNMYGTWAPQAIKGVYGAVVGWVTNPVIATLALGSQAEHHLIVVEHDLEEGAHEGQEELDGHDREPVPTIPEDEEFHPGPGLVTPRRPSAAPTSPSVRHSMFGHGPVTPTVGRSRANSTASRSPAASLRGSSRPPLTANVSYLAPLPLGTGTPIGVGSPPATTRNRADSVDTTHTHSRSFTYSRPRRATVSSETESTRSYSYALGGTGGRAQRSRSNSVAPVPGLVVSSADGGEPSTAPLPRSGSVGSVTSTGSTGPTGLGMSDLYHPRTAPASSTPAWDVFGRRESAPAPSPNRDRSDSLDPASAALPRRRSEGKLLDEKRDPAQR